MPGLWVLLENWSNTLSLAMTSSHFSFCASSISFLCFSWLRAAFLLPASSAHLRLLCFFLLFRKRVVSSSSSLSEPLSLSHESGCECSTSASLQSIHSAPTMAATMTPSPITVVGDAVAARMHRSMPAMAAVSPMRWAAVCHHADSALSHFEPLVGVPD